tara:strand:+ start:2345 stop:2470 length:126 start_codon:yes stop_codon:yes gene_type:complete
MIVKYFFKNLKTGEWLTFTGGDRPWLDPDVYKYEGKTIYEE